MKLQKIVLVIALAAALILVLFVYLGHRESSKIAKNETSMYLLLRAAVEDNQKLRAQTGAYAISLNHLNSLDRVEFQRVRSAYQLRYRSGSDFFAINADPKEYGRTGIRSFYVDQTGVVRYEAGKSAGASSTSVQQR